MLWRNTAGTMKGLRKILPLCYDADRYMFWHNTTGIMKGIRKTFLKNYCGLFAYTLPNCYVRINYVINVNKYRKQMKLNLHILLDLIIY